MNRTDWKWFYLQLTAVLILLCMVFPETTSQTNVHEPKVVCYYTNWSVYRPGQAKFSPQNINPYLCTHLIYAFGGFTKDSSLKPFDKYQDIEQGGYAKFTGLKTYNKQLKTLLAIGGWNEASSRFSPMVANGDKRRLFVKNAIKYLRQNHFDGLDLDWEYPAFRDGGKPRDRANYAQFVQELREEFDREASKTGRPRLLLTMAVPAGEEYVEKGFDIPKLNKYLDWFNLLTYDYHSSQEPAVAHHAPLYPLSGDVDDEYNYDVGLNIDSTIQFYLSKGADSRKLVLGLPTYGRSYTLFNPEATELGSPTDGPGAQGDATREKGYLAYYEICQGIKEDPDWTVVHPNPSAMGPYAYNNDQWVGYDDEQMASRKAEYAAVNKLGGIMFWSIDNDDFRGDCTGKPYPIIEAAKSGYYAALGFSTNEVNAKHSGVKTLSNNKNRKPGKESVVSAVKAEKEVTLNSRRNSRKRGTTENPISKEQSEEILFVAVAPRTTPEPPTTPSPAGSGFKCESEGFYANPSDCKKYYWCLDSGPSELGIVAHHFTCPGGLIFNSLTDSCDYSRNVVCKTTKPKNKSAATTTTKAPVRTTTLKSSTFKVNPITLRSSNFRTTQRTTTTTTEVAEEYYDDEEVVEEEEPISIEIGDREAEDPAVLKELVKLINKAGGISNLEKQLLVHKNGSVVYRDAATNGFSTTTAPISASLYDKILTRNQVRKEYQPIRSRQNFASPSTEKVVIAQQPIAASTTSPLSFRKQYQSVNRQSFASSTENVVDGQEEEEESSTVSVLTKQYQSIRSRQNFATNTDNIAIASTSAPPSGVSYTGFSFNSRTGPQGQGIDQLNESEGFLRDKPKYTVLSRNKPTTTDSVEEITAADDLDIIPETTTAQKGIFQYNYVSLQRKPSTTSEEAKNNDKTDFTVIPETTIRPFTASAPRGFAPRYSTISRQNQETTIDEKLLFEEESTEKEIPTTVPIPVTTTTTTTNAPVPRILPAFRRKTSVSPDEEQDVDDDDSTITPNTETTETYSPEQYSSSSIPLLTETQPATVKEVTLNSQTDAPEPIPINDTQEEITEIPNDIHPIRVTFRPRIPVETTTTTTTTPIPDFTVSSNAPQVPQEKARKPLKIRPTRGPNFRPNDILPRGRAVTPSVDQEEGHSEASFQTVDVSLDQTYRVRTRGRSKYNFESIDKTINEGIIPRENKLFRSTTPEVFSSTASPLSRDQRIRARRPNRPETTTETDLSEVTKQIHRGRGFTSRARPTSASIDEDSSSIASEIPSPRNQPRRFESRFNGNTLSSTDSPIFRIKSAATSKAAEETTTSGPPIRITLNSALNFGYANKKQFRQQIFTIENGEPQEKSVDFKVVQPEEESPVIRPGVNVKFGVHVKEYPEESSGTTKSVLETGNLVTNQMERDNEDENIIASSATTDADDYSTRRTTIGILVNEDSSDDFKDSIIEGQTFIPIEDEYETTIASFTTRDEQEKEEKTTASSPSFPASPSSTTTLPSRGRTRLNIRKRPTTEATQVIDIAEENRETASQAPKSNSRLNFRSQRQRTTTGAPQLAENEEEVAQETSSPRNRFNSFRRRTTTEANLDAESQQEPASESAPVTRTRQRINFNSRGRQNNNENIQEVTRGEQLKNLEESLTLKPLGPSRARFSSNRLRTTTEAAEEAVIDEETSPLTYSSTFSPRSRSRFINGRSRSTTATILGEEEEEEDDHAEVTQKETSQRPINRFQSRFRTTTIAERNEDVTQEEEVKVETTTKNLFNKFRPNILIKSSTTSSPVEEPEAVTLNDEEELALRDQLKSIRAQSTTRAPETEDHESEENVTGEIVTAIDDELAVTESVPITTINRFQSLRNRFSTQSTTSTATPTEEDLQIQEEEEKAPAGPVTRKNLLARPSFTNRLSTSTTDSSVSEPVEDNNENVTTTDDELAVTESGPITTVNRFQSLRNRFSTQSTTSTATPTEDDVEKQEEEKIEAAGPVTRRSPLARPSIRSRLSTSTTESSVSEPVDENKTIPSSTTTNRFRSFQSRTRASTTEATEFTEDAELTPSSRPGLKRRIVKRPRQRTTEDDVEITPSLDVSSTTEGFSYRTSRRRRPFGTATEATLFEVTNEDQEITEKTQAPREPTRGRNIRPSLFNRNRINIENQQVDKQTQDVNTEENNDAPIENQRRVTQRRKIIRKKIPIETNNEENENIQQEEIAEEIPVEEPRKRKIIRRLRPKTTANAENLESATESLAEIATQEVTDGSIETTRPALRTTTLRRGKTQDLAKTLEELRRNRAQAQQNKSEQTQDQEEQNDQEEDQSDNSTPGSATTRGRYTPRSRAPFNPKRPSVEATTETVARPASPSARKPFSSRVKFGRKGVTSQTTANEDTTTGNQSETQVDNDEEDSPIVNLRPLGFTPSRTRLTGSRFRNTYKGTAGEDDEVRIVLKPSVRPSLFANRSRFKNQETSTSEKENEIEFEQVTEPFDDQQYVDDNYEAVTNSDQEVSVSSASTAASTTKKQANVPISIAKAKRPLYTPKTRKQNVPPTLRQPNVPKSADTTSPILGRKANIPVVVAVKKNTTDTEDTLESTTLDSTQSEETQTEATKDGDGEESSTDETNAGVNLQEYYARGGNGTPTPGPLSNLLNRFKPKKIPSTTTKPTTLHHVFAIDVDNDNKSSEAEKNKGEASAEEVSKKLRKLIEVNRIVEVNSKQEKVSPSEASGELGLVAEKLPRLDRIGEISRLAVVKLKTAQREGRSMNILLPEMLFGVETSTISLEGLFEKDRQAKELVVKEEKDEHNNTINVVFARTITPQNYPEYVPTSPLTTTTTTEMPPATTTEKYANVVRPLVPMLRPESSDDNPYVITIANLDQVILQKVSLGGATSQTTTEGGSESGTTEFSDEVAATTARGEN